MNHVKYPYPSLRAGDMVCCDVRGVFPCITRVVTGGWRHLFDHDWSTHTGMLVQMGGQLFVVEMGGKGVDLNSLEVEYQKWDRRIICFRRLVGITTAKRNQIEAKLGEVLRRGTEYDYAGILGYVFQRVKQNRKRYYCSEMVYAVTHGLETPEYAGDLADKPSPQAMMQCAQWETVWHR